VVAGSERDPCLQSSGERAATYLPYLDEDADGRGHDDEKGAVRVLQIQEDDDLRRAETHTLAPPLPESIGLGQEENLFGTT
jgi:hypothetical protein